MFSLGSEQLKPYAEHILAQLTPLIAELPNKITIIGHTDAKPYNANGHNFSNWELSAGRANTARRAMLAAGLPEGQITRVSGMAAVLPFDAQHPREPVNRRIAILVLNNRAEQSLLGGAGGKATIDPQELRPTIAASREGHSDPKHATAGAAVKSVSASAPGEDSVQAPHRDSAARD